MYRKTISGLLAFLVVSGVAGCSVDGESINGDVVLDYRLVENEIENGVLAQTGLEVEADCPDPMSGKLGDSRQCVIEDDFGTTALVDVTIQNSNGDIVWQVR